MGQPFLGEIKIMSFGFAPRNWAMCNGQFLPINQNQALFSLLGTMYGGNGQTTFALPDLRGQTPIHQGPQNTIGTKGGEKAHTLSVNEMTQHTHFAQATSVAATAVIPTNSLVLGQPPFEIYRPPSSLGPMIAGMVGNVGGSQPHQNMQPFLTLTFCIALIGIFPSRN
jgi:microcystin-dependent protein